MKRLLVVHPYLTSTGGGDAVAAWALQSLRAHYRLTLATLGPVDFAAVNRSFGTELSPRDFELRVAPAHYRALLRAMPTPGALLVWSLAMRWAQDLDRKHHYDVILGTENAMDFHRRGLHYLHDVRVHAPHNPQDLRWFHRAAPAALSAYHELCRRIARSSNDGLRRNVALANSKHTAARLREQTGIEATVLYPPVPGELSEVPWSERKADIVCVGRLHPEKRWELAVDIVERVRQLGHDIRLTLVGHPQNPACVAALTELARARPWFSIRHDLSRADLLAELQRHRYGLHTMQNEPFGISVAELQRAGCITFVHGSGGPLEIVGSEPVLSFSTAGDAAQKIHSVLTDEALQGHLRVHVQNRAAAFTTERFGSSLLNAVSRVCNDC